MKATLTVTSRGVVTLPAKLRAALGLKPDDHLIAETTPEGLLLRPAVTLPVEGSISTMRLAPTSATISLPFGASAMPSGIFRS